MWNFICWLDWPAILSCVIVFGLWQVIRAVRQSVWQLKTDIVSDKNEEEE